MLSNRLSISALLLWSVIALPHSHASQMPLDEAQFAVVRPNCFLTIEHGGDVYIGNDALAEFLQTFSREYYQADTSANLARLRAERKALENQEDSELKIFSFTGQDSEESQRVLKLSRDLQTGEETPFTRGELPEHGFALLAWYFHEWEYIQKSCDAIRSKIIDILAEKRDNQSILEHLHENQSHFPRAWDNAALAMLDRFTSKETEKKDDNLSRGVVLMANYLEKENQRLEAEIFAFSEEHLLLVHRVSRLVARVNSPRLRVMVANSKKLLQESIDHIPSQKKPLIREGSDLVAKVLAVYKDKQEKLSQAQIEAVSKILATKSLVDTNIRQMLDECVALKNQINSEHLNNLLLEIKPIYLTILDLNQEQYRAAGLHKFLCAVPSEEHHTQKMFNLFHAGQSLTTDTSERDLHEALDTLKNGFNKELTQITNDMIENHAKGFFWENFVRWLLVNRTEGIVPPIIKSAVESLETKLKKPIEANPIEEPRPSFAPEREPDYKFARSHVSKIHFPPRTELQRNRGRVAEALICVIRNLPDDLFKDMVEKRVMERLDQFNRAEWVKTVSSYVARFGAENLVSVIKISLIDMIKQNSGDPALLALSSSKIDDLLAQRVAANEDQSALGEEILRLRDTAVPVLQAEVASLGALEKQAPRWISRFITSAHQGMSHVVEGLLPAIPYTYGEVGHEYEEPVELTWDTKMQQQLFLTRINLLTHVKELEKLRIKMRENSRPASPQGK